MADRLLTTIDYVAQPDFENGFTVDCLFWRDADGHRRGELRHVPANSLGLGMASVIGIYVNLAWRRRGIATALIREAVLRWGPIDVDRQSYTLMGAAFIRELQRRGEVPSASVPLRMLPPRSN